MASWQKTSSSPLAPRTDRRRYLPLPALVVLALLAGGCGHADDHEPAREVPPASAVSVSDSPPEGPGGASCIPATTGALRARLQGAIDAEVDWGPGAPHCLASLRPQGDGVRLVYKGSAPEVGPLLIVFGLAPLRPGESARNVPVNLTVVREGTGQFFATQGQDKCALDSVTQAPVAGEASLFRLEGRGYCTQPARAVGGEGALLVSRFDVVALVPAAADGVGAGGQVKQDTR